MKRVCLTIFVLFMCISKTAYAEFDSVLNDMLSDYGVYDGKSGIISASINNFVYEEPFLFLCYAEGNTIKCPVYNSKDGVQCVDVLEIEFKNNIIFSNVIYDETSYLMLEEGEKTEYFAILGDAFTHIPQIEYSKKTVIFEITGNKFKPKMSYKEIYNFLNSMKKEKINAYPFMNKANTLEASVHDELKLFLDSCADLTSFDINNYQYDRIFKYVLFTHTKFIPFTHINPHTDDSDKVKRVNAEFIDFIMEKILNILPEHPPATDLVKRGFCYSDGLYLYSGGFNADYQTQILGIEAVHDLGGGRYHIIFSDIYTENGVGIPEYSYAIVDTIEKPYRLLRIGMGETFLRTEQIRAYAIASDLTTPAWEMEKVQPQRKYQFGAVFWAMVFVAFLVICTVIIIIIRKDKSKNL